MVSFGSETKLFASPPVFLLLANVCFPLVHVDLVNWQLTLSATLQEHRRPMLKNAPIRLPRLGPKKFLCGKSVDHLTARKTVTRMDAHYVATFHPRDL